jgi:hypothetical protein
MQFIAMMFPLTTREVYAPCSFSVITDILEFTAMRPIPIYLSNQNRF